MHLQTFTKCLGFGGKAVFVFEKHKGMRTTYERIKASTALSTLWMAAHSDRKLPKATVRMFEIRKSLQCIGEAQDLKLNILSRFLLGLVKIYFLKYKIAYEDFHGILTEKKEKTRKKLFKALPLKPITVEPETKLAEVVETGQGTKKADTNDVNADEEVMEPSVTSNDNFEVGYGTIEEIRGSTTQSATATQIEIQAGKRKKSMLDTKIEYDQEFFDRKVRNLKEILRREGFKKHGVDSILGIQPEIIRALMVKTSHMGEQSIEVARGQSTTDVSYDMGYGDTYIHSRLSLSDSLDAVFGLHNLPDVFTFNVVVAGFSKREKANSFMALLTFIINGQVSPYQAEPYGPIECTVV